MKNITKIISSTLLFSLCYLNIVNASEVGGTLNPGLDTGIGGTVLSEPVATPIGGMYTLPQNVSLAVSGTESIHYTTDGTIPNCSTGTIYSASIFVGTSQTINAIACYANGFSSVASFIYTINLLPPSANPSSGTYTSAQSVALKASGSDKIYYTTDGTAPTCATGVIYSDVILVSSTKTIKAVACYSVIPSSVVDFNYTISSSSSSSSSGGSSGSSSSGSSGGGGLSSGDTTSSKTGDINKDGGIDE